MSGRQIHIKRSDPSAASAPGQRYSAAGKLETGDRNGAGDSRRGNRGGRGRGGLKSDRGRDRTRGRFDRPHRALKVRQLQRLHAQYSWSAYLLPTQVASRALTLERRDFFWARNVQVSATDLRPASVRRGESQEPKQVQDQEMEVEKAPRANLKQDDFRSMLLKKG